MIIEFKGRFYKEPEPISEEQKTVNRVLGIEEEVSKEVEYIYRPITFDLEMITRFNQSDDLHTTVVLGDGDVIVVATPFRTFKYMYEFLTGRLVRSVEDFGFQEMLIEKSEQLSELLDKIKSNKKDAKLPD